MKDCNVGAETMCSGREFQIWAAAIGKARLPTVDSLTGDTTSRLVPAERSARRPGTSAVEMNGPWYRGASPWMICMLARRSWNGFAPVHAANVDFGVAQHTRPAVSAMSVVISYIGAIHPSEKAEEIKERPFNALLLNCYLSEPTFSAVVWAM